MKKTIDEIVNNLKKEGASFHKKLGIESVGFGQTQPTENGVYTPIYINLSRTVPGFVANKETGEYELGETDVIFTSDIALNAILKRDPTTRVLVKLLKVDVENYDELLSDATIDVIGESVEENQEYVNPFSTLGEVRVVKHTSIYYNVVKIHLGPNGLSLLEEVKASMREIRKDTLRDALRKKANKPAYTAVNDEDDDD